MSAVVAIPSHATPIERVLSRFDRRQLAGFIAVAIDLLDMADGDADLEPDPVESDGTEEDAAWTEWDRRSGRGRRAAREEAGLVEHEDAEAVGDEEDGDDAEDEPLRRPWWFTRSGPGCTISDSDREDHAD